MEFLREHLLYLMVNGQSRDAMQEKTQTLLDMSFVRDFCRMVLLECANNYFEQVNSEQIEKMQNEKNRCAAQMCIRDRMTAVWCLL